MSSSRELASIILAAGSGTRLKSNRPKALHEVCGRPMLYYVLRLAAGVKATRHVVVIGHEGEQITEAFGDRDDLQFVEQRERLGTGHAVSVTEEALSDFDGDVLILAGDTPLITSETLERLVSWHRHQDAAVTILTAEMPDPKGYGRILRFEDNRVQGIVEDKDANRYERVIREVNTGTYCFDARKMFAAVRQLGQDNVQNEYYLTDCIRILADEGSRVEAVMTEDHTEAIGVNTRVQLAEAERILRERIIESHMLNGITVWDPASCYVDEDVTIGKDTVLLPGTLITGNTTIGENCRLGPNSQIISSTVGDGVCVNSSYLEEVQVGTGECVGPFATLRKGKTTC